MSLAPLRIALPVHDERELAEKFGELIGPGGIRIPTSQARGAGELCRFELTARDGAVLFQGSGAVVRAVGSERERALLLRYQKLEGPDRAALDRILLLKRGVKALALAKVEPERGLAPAPPGEVLALDLGGSFARAALWVQNRPKLVNVAPGSTALPAAVAFDEQDHTLLGARARAQRALDPRSGIASPLPLLALDPKRARDDAERGRLAFPLRETEGGPVAELPGRAMPAVELFAAVVGELKGRAQDALGQLLTEAHLAIPSTLDMRAKHLLQLGLRRAGIASPVLVDSALAIAAHYGLALDRAPPGPVVVVDWGGTRLQVAVLADIDGRLDVLAAGQKRHLGGASIDERIAKSLREPVERALGHALEDAMANQRLLDAAEAARVSLASQPRVQVRIPFLAMTDAGAPVDLDVTLDAASTLRTLEPALDQVMRVVGAVLEGAGVEPAAVHKVLLAGGQAAWPRLHERLASRFPNRVLAPVQPEAAAVLGVARVAAEKRKQRADPSAGRLTEPVSAMGSEGKLLRVFDRNTPLPAKVELRLQAAAGEGLICPLVEGAVVASGRGYLGAVALPGARGEVRLSAQIDARRILDVDLSCGALHAHGRFPLHSAAAGISASVYAQAPLPGESEVTEASALGH